MIVLDKIKVFKYRKFFEEEISFDNNITVIAGSNNSGKTSIVELLSSVFIEKKDSIKIDDLHSKARLEDENKILEIIENEGLTKYQKKEKLENIHKDLNKIEINITTRYTEDNDNIEFFSKYLADVDITKRNYYLKFVYEYAPVKEKEIIEILDGYIDFREVYSILQSKIYYCDECFLHEVQITNRTDFYKLFNVHCVYAIRKLADTSEEKQNHLSKQLLTTVKNNPQWKDSLQKLISNINDLLIEQELSKEIDTITIGNIKETLESFSKTNGGNAGNLGVDFKLEKKDIEKVLLDFTHIYFEQEMGLRIKEQKQGLGYSNLIYLLLEAQRFNEKYDSRKVNLLIFEEPEAHLHPQMEHVFIRYITALQQSKKVEERVFEKVGVTIGGDYDIKTENDTSLEKKYEYFQMLITTHSTEMTKNIGLEKMRILRPNGYLNTKVYDLDDFMKKSKNKDFYNKFFQFNMIEVIFADKLILFEGDAERLLLKYLIVNDNKYEKLSSQYISYIQVGGAYAYKYIELMDFLKIKTLIYTDIDYRYSFEDDFDETGIDIMVEINETEIISEILKRETSNETLINIVKNKIIEDIYNESKIKKGLYLPNDKICLKFQTDQDGFARTLEDAILYNLGNVTSVFTKISREDLEEFIITQKIALKSSKKKETNFRDRVDKLKNKTDFMYSLIESGKIRNAIPKYIEEGLDWLKD